MTKNMIYKLRTSAEMSQEEFAELFGVSRQAVQKWEKGISTPDLKKLIEIAKHFNITIDELISIRDARITKETKSENIIHPQYSSIYEDDFYASNAILEYYQSIEEGLDIEAYKDLFFAVSKLPKDENKEKLGNILFKIVSEAGKKENYPYDEPYSLEEIHALRKKHPISSKLSSKTSENKIHGAWMGRICGCLLGKNVEGIRRKELITFLKDTDNYPMHRYILKSDIEGENKEKHKHLFYKYRAHFADAIDAMPIDDDINYTVLAQIIIENFGRSFTPKDVANIWQYYQSKYSFCTAERVAYCNFINGYAPPITAIYKNPYREWIGAQIRGDYYGYINPGNPEMAAEMAWRDASISHIKNGIYGEMFVSAMLAAAASTDNIEDIILCSLSEIPYTSRLYENIMFVLDKYKTGISQKDLFSLIHQKYDEYNSYHWTHTIPNAMIVVASLLYGNGDYSKSICMAVETGFDTDCNGATVGSIVGMIVGIEHIDKYWINPINDTLHTAIFKNDTLKISDIVKLTLEHIK